jgi:hypothetical protein
MTFASDPHTEARRLEELGRRTAQEVFVVRQGHPRSRMKYFIDGFNEIARSTYHSEFTVELRDRPKPKQLGFFEKLKFKWNRFLYKRGWKKGP